MAAAGYSATPLPRKLGFKPGMTAVYLDAPEHLDELLGELEGVTVKRSLRGHADLVLCFVTRRSELARRAAAAARGRRARRDGVGVLAQEGLEGRRRT